MAAYIPFFSQKNKLKQFKNKCKYNVKDERKKQLASKLDGGPWKFYVFYWKKFFFTKVGDKQRVNIQNQVIG